jgi:hypothetical protein
LNARLLTAFRWLARLAGHADTDVELSSGPHAVRSLSDNSHIYLWGRASGRIDIEFTHLTNEQADHLLRAMVACGVCDDPTPATDRVVCAGRPAHAACAFRAHLGVPLPAPVAVKIAAAPAPRAPLVLHEEGCTCRLPPCDADPFVAVDMNPHCPVHRADIEALRNATRGRAS